MEQIICLCRISSDWNWRYNSVWWKETARMWSEVGGIYKHIPCEAGRWAVHLPDLLFVFLFNVGYHELLRSSLCLRLETVEASSTLCCFSCSLLPLSPREYILRLYVSVCDNTGEYAPGSASEDASKIASEEATREAAGGYHGCGDLPQCHQDW